METSSFKLVNRHYQQPRQLLGLPTAAVARPGYSRPQATTITTPTPVSDNIMTMLQQGASDQPNIGEYIFSDGKVGFSAEPVLHTSDDIAIPTVWVTTVPAPTGPNSSDGTLLSITAVVVLWAMLLIMVWAQFVAIAVWLCCFSRKGREMWRALWGWVCSAMLRFFMWARFLDARA